MDKGIQVCKNEGPGPFTMENNNEEAKNTLTTFENPFLQNH